MPPAIARAWLAFNAAVLVLLGGWALFAPDAVLASLGLRMEGIGATIEIQAMYGGLQLGLAGPLIVGVIQPRYQRPALLLTAFMFAGLGFGRIVGLGLVNSTWVFWALAGLEGAMSVISAMVFAMTRDDLLVDPSGD